MRRQRGLTLIDLLIAVAVLGVLAAIALPSYREQLARARRTDVQAVLLEDADYMQRYYAANNAFTATPPPALTVTTSPRTGGPSYRVTVTVPADLPNSYLLTATRTGAMAGDRCGDFTYDDLGRKGLVAGTFDAGLAVESCWR